MISESVSHWQHPRPWQQALARAIRDPAELLARLKLPDSLLPAAIAAAQQFPLRVPHSFLARMQPGNPHDPLLRQVLPLADENQSAPGFNLDPVGDNRALVSPGLLHKYAGRVLVITTGACAIHCRYCFRRHFPYHEAQLRDREQHVLLDYLRADPSLSEVILSGGDPLSLSDQRLAELIRQLEGIPHITRLRLHTRLPIVIPERIDQGLLGWLTGTRLQTVVVLHINHAQEIDAQVEHALRPLRDHAITLLNQAVLLRGVNDHVSALAELSERLFSIGILPYYLHQLDRTVGTHHFEVEPTRARELHQQLSQRLSGYLVPRLVQEIPGAAAKLAM